MRTDRGHEKRVVVSAVISRDGILSNVTTLQGRFGNGYFLPPVERV